MRLSSVAVGLGLIALIGACATPGDTPPSGATSGSPAPTPGYDWFFHDGEGELSLAYGVAETDDVPISLDCRAGTGRIDLVVSAEANASPVIHLESGGETERLSAASEASPLHSGVYLTAEVAAAAPVFQRFQRVGWLAVWEGETRRPYAPQEGSVEGVERFFARCG